MSITLQGLPPRVLATEWLPLNRAALCADCETVHSISARECPVCGGTVRMPLQRWLKTVQEKRKEKAA